MTSPAPVHIDVAAVAAACEAGLQLPPGSLSRAPDVDPPVPYTALEHALLEEARKSAEGTAGEDTPPRRELIRVVFRELRREQALRDAAEERETELRRTNVRLLRTNDDLRATRHGLLQIQYELIAALAEHYGCEPSARAVLARVRAARPGLAQAIATEMGAVAAGAEVARG